MLAERGKVQVGGMSLRVRVPGSEKGEKYGEPRKAVSPSILVGKWGRGRSQYIMQSTHSSRKSSNKAGWVSVRCDGARMRGKLPPEVRKAWNLQERLLKMMVHLFMSPGWVKGTEHLRNHIGRWRHWVLRGQ